MTSVAPKQMSSVTALDSTHAPSPQEERPSVPNTDSPSTDLRNAPPTTQSGTVPTAHDAQPAGITNTLQRERTHGGQGAAESKPAPHPSEHSTGPGGKIAADGGPPQPDWEKAEQERQERHRTGTGGQDSTKDDYPEPIHAGAVGVGPEYGQQGKTDTHGRLQGMKEVVKGKLTKNQDLAETGRKRMTGELAREQQEEADNKNPFGNAKDEGEQDDGIAGGGAHTPQTAPQGQVGGAPA